MLTILSRLEINLFWNEQSSVKEITLWGTYLNKKITEFFPIQLTCELKAEPWTRDNHKGENGKGAFLWRGQPLQKVERGYCFPAAGPNHQGLCRSWRGAWTLFWMLWNATEELLKDGSVFRISVWVAKLVTEVQMRSNSIFPGMWLFHETSLTFPNSPLVLKVPSLPSNSGDSYVIYAIML